MTYEHDGSESKDDEAGDDAPCEEDTPTTSTVSTDDAGDVKSMVGRPSKYTLELKDAICAGIAAGLSVEKAVESVGIGTCAYYAWIAKGKRVEQRDDVDQLDEEEFRCLLFLWAIQQAKEEYFSVLERAVFDAEKGE